MLKRYCRIRLICQKDLSVLWAAHVGIHLHTHRHQTSRRNQHVTTHVGIHLHTHRHQHRQTFQLFLLSDFIHTKALIRSDHNGTLLHLPNRILPDHPTYIFISTNLYIWVEILTTIVLFRIYQFVTYIVKQTYTFTSTNSNIRAHPWITGLLPTT